MTTPVSSREERLRRLLDVGRGLVSEFDLEAVLARVLEAARELTGARYAALGVLDARRETLERFITVGMDEEIRRARSRVPDRGGRSFNASLTFIRRSPRSTNQQEGSDTVRKSLKRLLDRVRRTRDGRLQRRPSSVRGGLQEPQRTSLVLVPVRSRSRR